MSNVARVAGQAANTLVKPLEVEDVFSTYLNSDGSSNQVITNGIDLAGEGGLVWGKSRNLAEHSFLADSARGKGSNNNFKYLRSGSTAIEQDIANRSLSSMNSNGFTFQGADDQFNSSGNEYVYWTFRKAPKFFDIVTYTGNGVAGRTVSHNLGSVPGCIIVKATNNARSWAVYHRGTDSTAPEDYGLYLNENTNRSDDAQLWNDTAPTSTEFTVGTDGDTNVSGRTYVAYLFAHNDGDGEFGPDGDADIIKCGSYTGTGASQAIDLGFEPQWVLIKNTTNSQSWAIIDSMRGFTVEGLNDEILTPNQNSAEAPDNRVFPTSSGFGVHTADYRYNGSGSNYIYIAIRRPTAVPESATDVFGISYAQDENTVPFPVDFMLTKIYGGGYTYARDRLRGGTKYLLTSTTHADLSGTDIGFDDMTGTGLTGWGTSFIHYNWKRAPKYMDVVAYEGTGSVRTVSHNLGVAPEMMWIKRRDSTGTWCVYHTGLDASSPEDYFLYLDTQTPFNNANMFNDTAPTSSVFTVNNNSNSNTSGGEYIAYLFATLAGISKVGSVTHSGTTNVDCGFTSGARFVLLKRTDATGDWYVWDSERGIVSGNDPYLLLNTTGAEVTNTDYIDPLSSGFTITSSLTAGDYIFYAIA